MITFLNKKIVDKSVYIFFLSSGKTIVNWIDSTLGYIDINLDIKRFSSIPKKGPTMGIVIQANTN